jgi:sulfite exporter TauE/SafE
MFAYTLAGLAAGEAGAVLDVVLKEYHIPFITSFLFGGIIVLIGLHYLCGWEYPAAGWIAKSMAKATRPLSTLMLHDRPWPTFLFGMLTIALPCGQTVLVFSACALSGDALVGMVNGFAFALLTSPGLLFAMQAHALFAQARQHYNMLIGASAVLVGVLALLRGIADIGIIPHLVLNPGAPAYWHLVIY